MRLTWSRATGRPRANGRPSKANLNRAPVLPPQASAEFLERLLGELAAQQDSDGLLPGPRLACPSRTLFWRPTPLPSRQPTGAHGGSCPHQSSRSRPAARLSERSTYGHPASRPGIRRSLSSRYSISKACRARLPKGAAPPAKQRAPCFYPRRLRCLPKTPADAHHLKFAQPRTLRRKVSDADRTINRFNTAMDELGGESANLPAPDS